MFAPEEAVFAVEIFFKPTGKPQPAEVQTLLFAKPAKNFV